MEPQDWFWEGNVQRRVADRLRADGWKLLASADTLSRQTGIDLVLERDNERLNIEVKGWPSNTYRRGPKAGQPKSTNPSVQARHWFASALLTAALLRDANPHARVALALPDFDRYRDLLRRTAHSMSAMQVEALLVGEDAEVQWVDPAELQRRTVRAGSSPSRVSTTLPRPIATTGPPRAATLTLHEAMTIVLHNAPGGGMPAADLANEINRRGLYQMRDGRPVEVGQIHARARNYVRLFTAGDGIVHLRR